MSEEVKTEIEQAESAEEKTEPAQDGKKKRKKLNKKQAIIVSVVSVVMALVLVFSLVFTQVNELRFMTYTKEKMQANALIYQTRYENGDIKFIAHRGLSVEAYQNSLDAFILAGQDEKIYGIETDIWMTSDGGMVCMHDRDSLKGVKNVNSVTLAVATSTPLKGNESVYAPTLQQYLDVCKTYGKAAIIELKDDSMSHENVDTLMQIVTDCGVEAQYISFYFELLDYIRSKDSAVELQLLSFKGVVGVINDPKLTYSQEMQLVIDKRINLSCSCHFLTKGVAERFHAAGLKIGVWTTNDPKIAICCAADFHVDYITTDVRLYNDIDTYIEDLIK